MSGMEAEQEPDEPQGVVDRATWDAATDEVRARDARASRARWVAWMVAIVVSWLALMATFAGVPLPVAMSVLIVMLGAATVFARGGVRVVLTQDTPHLDEVRGIVLHELGVEADREEAGRLVGIGGMLVGQSRVRATEELDGVVLRVEVLEPDPESPWGYPTGYTP